MNHFQLQLANRERARLTDFRTLLPALAVVENVE